MSVASHQGNIAPEPSSATLGYFGRVFSREALVATAILVLLPNILYIALSPVFMIRRVIGPLVYLLAGIIALLLPWPFSIVLFMVAAAADVFFIICFTFNMPFETSLQSLRYHADIDVAASLLYVACAAYAVIVLLAVSWAFNKYREVIRRASLLVPAALAFGVATLDLAVNGFSPLAKPEFESVLSKNGFDGTSIPAVNRNLLIVMVEGLGAYADPEERELIAAPLRAAAGDRFEFSTGVNRHWGSTTGATLRELCGRWATFTDYYEGGEFDCLPRRLADAGYETAAYHASYGDLFSRPYWYPGIGFKELNFREDIERNHPTAAQELCGTVFPGLCDRAVGDLVHEELAGSGDQRKMIYWLTLNSHLPYVRMENGPLGCNADSPAIASQMPCELTEIWIDVVEKVADIATDPRLPPTDIFVIGDHNTPMWSRKAASHFIDGKVDWYLLRDRNSASVMQQGQTYQMPSAIAASVP